MGYQNLRIWQLSDDMVPRTFRIIDQVVPSIEQVEIGRQLRRSINSVKSNITEGYGSKHYQQEYLRFLTFARRSLDESREHLRVILQIHAPGNEAVELLIKDSILLGKMMTSLIKQVRRGLDESKSEKI